MGYPVKVSVCVVTYNQIQYVRQCLASIVDQVVDFKFEIIVSDDGSTDGTRDVISEFANKYPGLFTIFFHEKNMGPYKNFVFVHDQALGEYVAHVDGDDYLLPNKIKAQVDFLDNNPGCNLVWHGMRILGMSDIVVYDSFPKVDSLVGYKFYRPDVLQFIAIGHNSSKMYRKAEGSFEIPDFDVVDYYANVYQVRDGYAAFLPGGPYGVYRQGVGISSSGNKTRLILANCFLYFSKKFPECRLNVNVASLGYFLYDLKNLRRTSVLFFWVWLKTFDIRSFAKFLRSLKVLKKITTGTEYV